MTRRIEIIDDSGNDNPNCIFRASLIEPTTGVKGWVIESEQYDEKGKPKESVPIHAEFDYVIRKMKEVLTT